MNNYLVVFFDRYDTTKSTNHTVSSDTPISAIHKAEGSDDAEQLEMLSNEYEQVTDTFGCVSGDEQDILVYSL